MLKILPQLRGAAAGKYKNNFDTKHAYEICGYICSDDETWRIIKHIFSFVFYCPIYLIYPTQTGNALFYNKRCGKVRVNTCWKKLN
jgi:hypothetical protein